MLAKIFIFFYQNPAYIYLLLHIYYSSAQPIFRELAFNYLVRTERIQAILLHFLSVASSSCHFQFLT